MRPSFLFISLVLFSSAAAQFAARYELVKLNREVNTFYHDAAPVISQDGKQLYFFIHNHPENNYGKEGSDEIWMSTLNEKGEWTAAKHLGPPFNIHRSNQVFTCLPDGSLFIKGGRVKDTKGFSIVNPAGVLTEIEVPGFREMNKGRFYGASMSSDGKHIIMFFSEMPNSQRSSLYVSNNEGGKWTMPKRLNISVRDDDVGPFIGPDDKTLYFSSDRNAPGKKGKADIYRCTRLDDTWQNWSVPLNMGAPINTAADELYFCIDKPGNVFTSRSNSTQDGGNLDLFKLVPRDVKVIVAGVVYNEKTQQPIQANVELKPAEHDVLKMRSAATGKFETRIPEVDGFSVSVSEAGYLPKSESFTIPPLGNDTTITIEIYLTPVAKQLVLAGTVYDLKTSKPIPAELTIYPKTNKRAEMKPATPGGKYEQEIKQLGRYILVATAEGYLTATDSVEVISEDVTPVIKDIALQPIEVGLTVRLDHIYFDFDKTTLKKESYEELAKVIDFLKRNPTVEIEIAGHTDSKGSDEYNQRLSQGRTQAVVDYLVSQGISARRLVAMGYGESKPVDTNETEGGRAKNRRVEFTVLKM
ncbi:MAG: OmpA family protein [Flammeovirgaceae bacterium]|nr:MAG: OmpA family protein [Flammeovirgaceae bacterium]